MTDSRTEPSSRRLGASIFICLLALVLLPVSAQAASLQVVFPQQAEATVTQGQTAGFTLEVQAFGATRCSATTAPVRIDTLYSVDTLGDIGTGDPADMPIETAQTRGKSDNCYIKTPVIVPLTVTAALDTPPGEYHSVIRYGKGGDGGVDLDGPPLTVHVLAADAPAVQQPDQPVELPPEELAPPEIIVLGEREAAPQPTLGKTLMIAPVKDRVTYRTPGNAVATLTGVTIVPNGTLIDAKNGVVKVTVVRNSGGGLDTVDAWGGAFRANQVVSQGRGLTTFQLSGALPAVSNKVASAAKAKGNLLWVNGKGNFKTRGKRASAIIRGTYWLTQDTGSSTKVSVKRGLVAVRDFVQKRTVLVSTGHTYTAKPRARQARRIPVFTGSFKP